MILVDTSVWVNHLRATDQTLSDLLNLNQVLVHCFVIGELACGHIRNRAEVLALLQALPRAPLAQDEEVLFYIERHALMGCGIGYVDAHLLASVALNSEASLWTYDKRLSKAAKILGMA